MSSEELERIKTEYLEKMKKVALIEAGFPVDEAGDYVKYIKADNEDEIKRQALGLFEDVKQHITPNIPQNNTWKPF